MLAGYCHVSVMLAGYCHVSVMLAGYCHVSVMLQCCSAPSCVRAQHAVPCLARAA
jgi:hypothetical protein